MIAYKKTKFDRNLISLFLNSLNHKSAKQKKNNEKRSRFVDWFSIVSFHKQCKKKGTNARILYLCKNVQI